MTLAQGRPDRRGAANREARRKMRGRGSETAFHAARRAGRRFLSGELSNRRTGLTWQVQCFRGIPRKPVTSLSGAVGGHGKFAGQLQLVTVT